MNQKGSWAAHFMQVAGELLTLFYQTLFWCRAAASNRDKSARQIYEIGNATLPVAAILAIFTGGVLSLQAGSKLAELGAASSIGGLVGVAMIKELGPMLIALLVAGRVGSAMAAEVGAMNVYDEIDALKTLDIDPVRFLVMPRFVGSILAVPLLGLYTTVIGWFGGAVVAKTNILIRVSFTDYFDNLFDTIVFGDVVNGILKSAVFGLIIALVSCYQGLKTSGGPQEIAGATTRAVVLSFILIFVSNYFISRMLL